MSIPNLVIMVEAIAALLSFIFVLRFVGRRWADRAAGLAILSLTFAVGTLAMSGILTRFYNFDSPVRIATVFCWILVVAVLTWQHMKLSE